MIHMKVKPFLHVNHNVWFLFIVVFLNESRETAWEMYLPLLCHWGWKRRHEWTQDLYFCANNSKKWGPELVKRGPERTQDLYSGLYSEKGRSWVSEKRSRADSGPLFWTLQWKREVLSLWKELLRVSHFLKLLHKKPPLFLHHGEQCAWWRRREGLGVQEQPWKRWTACRPFAQSESSGRWQYQSWTTSRQRSGVARQQGSGRSYSSHGRRGELRHHGSSAQGCCQY